MAGDIVEIGEGQTIYLDTDTPVLEGVIINGGALIFDDSQHVHLRAEYIVVNNSGLFQVGTQAHPFTHNALITMYGSPRSIELPMFGRKVIAIRNGTIDMVWQYIILLSIPMK